MLIIDSPVWASSVVGNIKITGQNLKKILGSIFRINDPKWQTGSLIYLSEENSGREENFAGQKL